MNKKLYLTALLAASSFVGVQAQRFMDKLDRGLIAVKQNSGVYVSWRIFGTEYYGVGYNVYRNGTKLNNTPLYVSNFTDAGGSANSKYTIAPVVNGVEQSQCKAAPVWENDYLVIPKAKRTSNDGKTDITNSFEPNDATFADVDGDGEMEVIVKQINTTDQNSGFAATNKDFDRIEVYKLDGTLLWWIDCGPNLTDFQHNETNIAVYDWDMDGKAEAVMRAADGTVIHMADGTTKVIGDASKNYRTDGTINKSAYFIHDGAEYLVYMNGQTGAPYSISEYPLKRLESGETDLNAAWGDGYGHRSTKHFFGAPYLDGKKPSIFLARGIYTRHKMITYDVDPATHKLTERWRWNNNTPGSSWYGQGYHNYSIADVDLDGRDEIVFGSMVIDDSGKGLSTTGLGHGDSHHVGDFNPYLHGLEIFACNEDRPGNNFRDATTSKIYYRLEASRDDGRALAGNFTNDIPGAVAMSSRESAPVSLVANDHVDGLINSGITQNFRIYWDGDLCEESFDGRASTNSNGAVYKYKQGIIKSFDNTHVNNDTKATPCFQGDIFGDWREEIALRDDDNNIRIETTTIPTQWRNYTLLHDPQYRNAMVWQMNGYNQTPHTSYYLGEMEGITIAPPPATKSGKVEVANGGTISSAMNGKQVLLDETGNATYTVADGVSPEIFFDNAPTWVKGHDDNDNIEYLSYTHTVKGGAFTGNMRLVKQGDGELTLPNVEQTYTGNTDVWAGTLNFDGTMKNSRVWLNRFATLNSKGNFPKGIEAEYGATVRVGGKDVIGTLTTDSLKLNFGSILDFDIADDGTSDVLTANVLKLEKKDWKVGPEYLAPRFNFTNHGKSLKAGEYVIAKVGKVEGSLEDVQLSGLLGSKYSLAYSNGELKLIIQGTRDAATTTWTGAENGDWRLTEEKNFKNKETGEADFFVSGDDVVFEDGAAQTTVTIKEPVVPGSITFNNNSSTYTIKGDSIAGMSEIIKNGEGTTSIENVNSFVGQTTINEGTLKVSNLAYINGASVGALGNIDNQIILNGGTLEPTATINTSHPVMVNEKGGSISVPESTTFSLYNSLSGKGTMFKEGNGILVMPTTVSSSKMYVNEGVVQAKELSDRHAYPSTVVLNGGTIKDPDDIYTYSKNYVNVEVPEGSSGSWYMDQRCEYYGTLTGAGVLNAYATGPRMAINGNWDSFAGTLNAFGQKTGSYNPEFTFKNAGMRHANLKVASGLTLTNSGKAFNIGNLEGGGTLAGSGRYTIGYRNEKINFSGVFSSTSFTKVGSGIWTLKLNTKSTFNGIINVNGGTLNLSDTGSTTMFFGSQNVAVADSGVLAGRGYISRINVNAGGTLAPGDATATTRYGYIKANNATVYKNGVVEFLANSAKESNTGRTYLTVTSALEVNGTVRLKLRPAYKPAAGDSIVLWTCNSFAGTPSFELPDLSSYISDAAPYGLKWDTSKVASTKGTLRVVARTATDATGISLISAEKEVEASVYTTDGRYLGKVSATKATLSQSLKQAGYARGAYVVKLTTNNLQEVTKITVK